VHHSANKIGKEGAVSIAEVVGDMESLSLW
jgi:hypothetical protein